MLHNGRFQKEEQEHANEAHPGHNKNIILLVDVAQDKCCNQVAKHLGAHVERPEQGEIESFILLHSTI
ncbi:hypothetical protein FGO68_gene15162 [Halteria grandinella]|uniref:Uncharacterized protein n=1 Tax=Halteria grandinella TaxID=5974 RepID=A0A8J8NT77_HALGN|nr:hypothetical protein FGO68_gene15162 [Halteria grandinella]